MRVAINCLNAIICFCSRFVLHIVFGILDATVYGCSKGETFFGCSWHIDRGVFHHGKNLIIFLCREWVAELLFVYYVLHLRYKLFTVISRNWTKYLSIPICFPWRRYFFVLQTSILISVCIMFSKICSNVLEKRERERER